jgi:hypothetical protein
MDCRMHCFSAEHVPSLPHAAMAFDQQLDCAQDLQLEPEERRMKIGSVRSGGAISGLRIWMPRRNQNHSF